MAQYHWLSSGPVESSRPKGPLKPWRGWRQSINWQASIRCIRHRSVNGNDRYNGKRENSLAQLVVGQPSTRSGSSQPAWRSWPLEDGVGPDKKTAGLSRGQTAVDCARASEPQHSTARRAVGLRTSQLVLPPNFGECWHIGTNARDCSTLYWDPLLRDPLLSIGWAGPYLLQHLYRAILAHGHVWICLATRSSRWLRSWTRFKHLIQILQYGTAPSDLGLSHTRTFSL